MILEVSRYPCLVSIVYLGYTGGGRENKGLAMECAHVSDFSGGDALLGRFVAIVCGLSYRGPPFPAIVYARRRCH